MTERKGIISNWAGGVVTSGLSARQPASTSPHGYNSVLVANGANNAVPARRGGFKLVNNTVLENSGIIGQYEYRTVSAGVFTRYHVFVSNSGMIGVVDSDPSGAGTVTSVAPSVFTAIDVPDFAVANNLLFIVQPGAKRKLRGLTVEEFGIVRPSTPAAAAAGAAGIMTGTFDIRYTFVNGNTNHESSASDSVSVTVSSQQISVTSIDVSTDAQVTKRRVYIRNQATQTEYRLAATINNNTATSTTLNVDTSTLITLGPDTTSNEPVASTAKYLAWWNNRMFAADDNFLYWSGKNKPEAFDPDDFEPVGEGDGQQITGLVVFSDVLLIFKSRSIWVLSGLTPESWRLRPLFDSVGAVSRRSVVQAGGALWWWSDRGIMKWDGTGQPLEVGELLLGNAEEKLNLATDSVHFIQAAVDPDSQLVLWAYPETGHQTPNRIVAINYQLSAVASNKWDPFGVISSLATVQDDEGKYWLYLGGVGEFFRYNDADLDGVPSGTVTGTFTAGSTSVTTIPGSGFYTGSLGLVWRMVTIVDSNGQLVAQTRVASNTATQLTVLAFDATVGETYTFYIGTPNFEWDTIDVENEAFVKERLKFAYVQSDAQGGPVGVDVFTDANPDVPKVSKSFTASDGDKAVVSKRFKVGKVGLTWRLRIRHRDATTGFTLYQAGLRDKALTDKIA